MSRSVLGILTALAIAACSVDPPRPGIHEGAPIDGRDGSELGPPDAPPPPPPLPAPGTAMEIVAGAGRATSTTMSIDVQIGGGLPGPTVTSSETARPAPSLP